MLHYKDLVLLHRFPPLFRKKSSYLKVGPSCYVWTLLQEDVFCSSLRCMYGMSAPFHLPPCCHRAPKMLCAVYLLLACFLFLLPLASQIPHCRYVVGRNWGLGEQQQNYVVPVIPTIAWAGVGIGSRRRKREPNPKGKMPTDSGKSVLLHHICAIYA